MNRTTSLSHPARRTLLILITPIVMPFVADAAMGGGTTTLIREAVELAARRSGRELGERAARESTEQAVEVAVHKYGPQATAAISDGGLELLEAGTRYGDDVMRIAIDAGPAARRALALDAGNLVPLVRELGPEALELEARSPGIARKVFTTFGPDDARRIAKAVPAEDLPRLVTYAEHADMPHTRKLFLEAYEKEGRSIFERIPPKLILTGGLTTAMIYGTHRWTAPSAAVADQIQNDPDLARRTVDWMMIVSGGLLLLVTVAFLWRFGLLSRPHTSAHTSIQQNTVHDQTTNAFSQSRWAGTETQSHGQ